MLVRLVILSEAWPVGGIALFGAAWLIRLLEALPMAAIGIFGTKLLLFDDNWLLLVSNSPL